MPDTGFLQVQWWVINNRGAITTTTIIEMQWDSPSSHGPQAGSSLRLAALGGKTPGCWGPNPSQQPPPGPCTRQTRWSQVFQHNGGIREENQQHGL